MRTSLKARKAIEAAARLWYATDCSPRAACEAAFYAGKVAGLEEALRVCRSRALLFVASDEIERKAERVQKLVHALLERSK